MKYTTILFDLDGTLLPMDLAVFKKKYFTELVKSIAQRGYDAELLMKGIMNGIEEMLSNDGNRTNEKAFFDAMQAVLGDRIYDDIKYFRDFYDNEFDNIKHFVGKNPKAFDVINILKARGYRLILATNPVFPMIATVKRICWAGLSPLDFELITTYEDFHFSKPSKGYYNEILDRFDLRAKECLMVGNDTSDDLSAMNAGIDVFLVTDNLINETGVDISKYPNGGLEDLLDYLSLN